MKELTTLEHIKGIGRNTKKLAKKHWRGIAYGGLALLGGAMLIAAHSKSNDTEHDEEGEDILNTLLDSYNNEIAKRNPKIDEDIYTNIALQMESLIFDDSCDEGTIFATYAVDYPLNGDYSEGTWTTNKEVTITIKDIGNEEDK